MKNILFCALSALVLFAGCKKDDPKPVLKGMAIQKITVLGFPSLDNGATWDVLSTNPDIFIEYSKDNVPFYTTSYYQDATNNNQYVWNDYVYLNDPDALYTVSLYDYDDVLPHDLVGKVSFYVKDQNTSYTSLLFSSGPFQFEIETEFDFDPE